jgi:hypothetical protein
VPQPGNVHPPGAIVEAHTPVLEEIPAKDSVDGLPRAQLHPGMIDNQRFGRHRPGSAGTQGKLKVSVDSGRFAASESGDGNKSVEEVALDPGLLRLGEREKSVFGSGINHEQQRPQRTVVELDEQVPLNILHRQADVRLTCLDAGGVGGRLGRRTARWVQSQQGAKEKRDGNVPHASF